jgi:hypothetical protein
MANPVCTNCKPGDAVHHEEAVQGSGCQHLYDAVDLCMKSHAGNVSDCRAEWNKFRECHNAKSRRSDSSKQH